MSENESSDQREFARALVRFNSRVLGVVVGLFSGVGLFLATVVLAMAGGESVGPLMGQLSYFFPGYSVTLGGAVIGGLWASAAGYAVGFVFSRAYGPWLLRQAQRHVVEPGSEDEPGHDIARLTPIPMGVATGALLALALFAVTNWLWLRHGYESPKLGLLAHYLPGYTTTTVGSLIGAFWIFWFGAIGAAALAWLYNRVVDARFGG